MEDKHLDKLFKEALEDLTTDYDPTSWNELSERLDQEGIDQMSDEDFDHNIRERMNGLSEPYTRNNWFVFLEKLEAAEAGRFRLIASKIAEAALMLMLIFTFARYFPIIQNFEDTSTYAYLSDKFQDPNDGATQLNTLSPITLESAHVEKIQVINNHNDLTNRLDEHTYQENDALANRSKRTGYVKNRVDALPPLEPSNIDFSQSLPASSKASSEVEDKRTVDHIASAGVAGVDLSRKLWLNQLRNSSRSSLSISAFVSANVNRIHTPYDRLFNRDDYVQTAGGFGGGVSLLWGNDRINLETGIQYSAKSYAPERVVELFSPNEYKAYKAVSLEEIDLNIVSIPLNILYRFDNSGRWRFYTLAGISGQLAVNANYEKERKELAFPSSSFRADSESQFVNSSNRSLLESKDFSEGIFEGGSLQDNIFITLNAGIGAEYMISDNARIFAQPQYQINFFNTGLGPNDDRINIFSFQMGTRVDLNRH